MTVPKYLVLAMVLVVLGLASAVSVANAAPFDASLNRAYALAKTYWGQEPTSCTSLDREIVSDASLKVRAGEPILGEATLTIETPTPCQLFIARSLAAPVEIGNACETMIHEMGHLLGLDHSPDRRNVMNPRPITHPLICVRVAKRWIHRHWGPQFEPLLD